MVIFAVAFGTNVPTPLLLLYQERLDLSATVLTAAFGVYAAGLLPALLFAGPASDRLGRRPVVAPFVLLAAATSALFLLAASSTPVLFAGRFLQGAVSGVVFSLGSAWMAELVGDAGTAARHTTAALGSGWALGPLTSGVLAQWAPAPTVLPYVVHLALMAVGLANLPRVAETLHQRAAAGPLVNLGVPPAARRVFVTVVLPVAVGVFAFPSIAVTVLPLLLQPAMPGIDLAVTGLVAGVALLSGVAAQPLERRLGAARAGPAGLAAGAIGIAVSLVAAQLDAWPLLMPAAVLLGVCYGLCLACGLTIVNRIAAPEARGALTSTFYACAYLGFGAPLLLTLAGGGMFRAPLIGLMAVAAVAAAALATPPAQRLLAARP